MKGDQGESTMINKDDYDEITGLPKDKSYLEADLPAFLLTSIEQYINSPDNIWDCRYCELQSDINVAEVDLQITSEQAWYLREKYLGIKKEDLLI